jgi:hypothetical protein
MVGLAFVFAATTAGAQEPERDGATHAVQLQDVRTRANEIKDGVRRVHQALQTIGNGIARIDGVGQMTTVSVKNEMGPAFRLVRVRVFVDGDPELVRDDKALAALETLPAFAGTLPQGEHVVKIELRYKGNGAILPYLEAFTYDVTSAHVVTAAGTRPLAVTLSAFEQGDVTTPLDLRPATEWHEHLVGAR